MTLRDSRYGPSSAALSRRGFLQVAGATGLSVAARLAAPEAVLAAEPKGGGTLRDRFFAYPRSLDPHHATLVHIAHLSGKIYSRLIAPKAGPDVGPNELIPTPDLAERWERLDDLTYVLHLRRGVRWHDVAPVNGRELVSEDVKATFERIIRPDSTLALKNTFAPINTIETPDKYTIKLVTEQPYAPLLNHLMGQWSWIIPKEAAAGQFDLNQTPIGTGPFRFESFKRGDKATFVKNPYYFRQGLPHVERVETHYIEEAATALAALRSKQLDVVVYDRLYLDAEQTKKADPSIYVEPFYISNLLALQINTRKGPLNHPKVRQAISLALDRDAINSTLYFDQGRRVAWLPGAIGGPFPLPPDQAAQLYPYDPDKAKKLLVEAGYKQGFETSIATTAAWSLTAVDGAVMIAEMLKDVNIDVKVNKMEHASALKAWLQTREFELLYPASLVLLEADQWIYDLFHSRAVQNYSGINDPKLDQLAEAQRREMDEKKRAAILHDIQVYLAELCPSLPVLETPYYTYAQSYVKNYRGHRDMAMPALAGAWIEKA
jgi:peptide/nickel transport system substrate-binding protein